MNSIIFIILAVWVASSHGAAQTTQTSTPDTGTSLEQKLQQMSPEDRREFLKNHPEIRERIQQHREQALDKLQSLTPAQRQQYFQDHPKLKEFASEHPNFVQKVANGSEAGPGIKDPGHPRVNEVNHREQNQQQRIAQGIQSGTLTPEEAAKLENGENRIQRQEAKDLQANDGHLTIEEKKHLNQEENRVGRRIHRKKHN